MIEELISWIDKELKEIRTSALFLKYFRNEEIYKDEMDYYFSNKKLGIDMVMSNNFIITTIHLFSNTLNYEKFEGELPFNIEFSFTRTKIERIFGAPNKSGGGITALYIGFVPFWAKYYFDKYSLHFQYSVDDLSISMITIGSLGLEEYFNSELQ